MFPPRDGRRYLDGAIIAFALALLLFAPPLFSAWARPGAPWYLPYAVWLGVIVLTALVQRLRDHDDP